MNALHETEDVTVGMLVRWIDRSHMKAAKETPPNMDTMRHMQHLGGTVEHLMNLYRIEHPELNRTTPPHIRYREALRKIKDSIYNGSTFGASAAKATAQEALRD